MTPLTARQSCGLGQSGLRIGTVSVVGWICLLSKSYGYASWGMCFVWDGSNWQACQDGKGSVKFIGQTGDCVLQYVN